MTWILSIFLLCLAGCKAEQAAPLPTIKVPKSALQNSRAEKDNAFKYGEHSPLPEAEKAMFKGLRYFPEDPGYRFRLKLHHHEQKPTIKIATSTGHQRDAEKYGYFDFAVDGISSRLQVYKLLDIQPRYPGYLFVPFIDATSKHESYPGGRYLDLKENDSGTYDLDFNLAYNPSCAYGKPGYNCPIPPTENTIPAAIRAGEKNYKETAH